MKILIVDDERPARDKLRRLLSQQSDVSHIAEARDGNEALQTIRAYPPDLVFLDVQMPELDGISLATQLPEPAPLIVFVTAYDQYALQAFDANAIDYLMKPYDEARFLRALQKARERLQKPVAPPDHLLCNEKGRIQVVKLSDILWVEAADNYVLLHTVNGQRMLRQTLSGILEKLGSGFARCHRRYLVQLCSIQQFIPTQKGDAQLLMKGAARLPCSRQYRSAVLRYLKIED
ncbi:response regulator [Undibacterium sp.]|uniref:LytR/AlgR family response regulator transcription factor n=1 Tax=Undibacterium sp. TaxID=1914977 RepID=UPI0025D699AC|nr:response regulator [Undibacterium sp.]MCX7218316.1 response regulator [Burkholderiales bacterium]